MIWSSSNNLKELQQLRSGPSLLNWNTLASCQLQGFRLVVLYYVVHVQWIEIYFLRKINIHCSNVIGYSLHTVANKQPENQCYRYMKLTFFISITHFQGQIQGGGFWGFQKLFQYIKAIKIDFASICKSIKSSGVKYSNRAVSYPNRTVTFGFVARFNLAIN